MKNTAERDPRTPLASRKCWRKRLQRRHPGRLIALLGGQYFFIDGPEPVRVPGSPTLAKPGSTAVGLAAAFGG
jgi:hypothetical protein